MDQFGIYSSYEEISNDFFGQEVEVHSPQMNQTSIAMVTDSQPAYSHHGLTLYGLNQNPLMFIPGEEKVLVTLQPPDHFRLQNSMASVILPGPKERTASTKYQNQLDFFSEFEPFIEPPCQEKSYKNQKLSFWDETPQTDNQTETFGFDPQSDNLYAPPQSLPSWASEAPRELEAIVPHVTKEEETTGYGFARPITGPEVCTDDLIPATVFTMIMKPEMAENVTLDVQIDQSILIPETISNEIRPEEIVKVPSSVMCDFDDASLDIDDLFEGSLDWFGSPRGNSCAESSQDDKGAPDSFILGMDLPMEQNPSALPPIQPGCQLPVNHIIEDIPNDIDLLAYLLCNDKVEVAPKPTPAVVPEAPAPVTPPKRGRGRPRKVTTATESAVSSTKPNAYYVLAGAQPSRAPDGDLLPRKSKLKGMEKIHRAISEEEPTLSTSVTLDQDYVPEEEDGPLSKRSRKMRSSEDEGFSETSSDCASLTDSKDLVDLQKRLKNNAASKKSRDKKTDELKRQEMECMELDKKHSVLAKKEAALKEALDIVMECIKQ